MDRRPHKSSWKGRKKPVDEAPLTKKERTEEVDLREKLNKVKRNAKIIAVLLVIPILATLGSNIIPELFIIAFTFAPFILLIAIFIVVFWIYFPISDILKEPDQK